MFWLISSALNTLSFQTPGGDVKFVNVGEIFQLQNNKLLVKEFFEFLASPSTARLYRGRVPRLMSDSFTRCHTRDRVGETMASVSAGHNNYTDTDPAISERAATTEIQHTTSSPGVPPPHQKQTSPDITAYGGMGLYNIFNQ